METIPSDRDRDRRCIIRTRTRPVLTAMRQIGILSMIAGDEPDGGGKKWCNEIERMRALLKGNEGDRARRCARDSCSTTVLKFGQ